MDSIDYKICRTQQRLYEYAAKHGYDMEQFSDFFLSSDFCSRAFDTLYSRFQIETPVECMDFILEEADGKLAENAVKKADEVEADAAGFVGLLYRMLYFITPYTSKELCEKVPYSTVCRFYGCSPHETENYIAEDICRNLNLDYDPDKVELTV